MNIWLRMAIRYTTRQYNGSREVREKLRMYIVNEEFTIGMAFLFDAREVTHGYIFIFLLHRLINTTIRHIGTLRFNCRHLKSCINDGCFAADPFSNMMQLSFAADRILGKFFSPDRFRELDINSDQLGNWADFRVPSSSVIQGQKTNRQAG
jgi:hypothetical protein